MDGSLLSLGPRAAPGAASPLRWAKPVLQSFARAEALAGPNSPKRSDYDRPETIEETAELVTRLGGVGIPIVVDHLDKTEVGALADRMRAEHGRIDLLVNDIWGAEILKGGRRNGTRRSGSSIWRKGCAFSGWGSRRTW